MDFADMKIYLINSIAFFISLTEVEVWLKIILLNLHDSIYYSKNKEIKMSKN